MTELQKPSNEFFIFNSEDKDEINETDSIDKRKRSFLWPFHQTKEKNIEIAIDLQEEQPNEIALNESQEEQPNEIALNESQEEQPNEIALNEKEDKFEKAKNLIMAFSQNEEQKMVISNVESKGWLFSHKVTGDELNARMTIVQNHFMKVNESQHKIKQVFGVVYSALEALDEDYIQRIEANIKAIEKTSDDVREHQKTLEKQQRVLDKQQQSTDSLIVKIDKSVQILAKFKQKLDSLSHLTDIDKIWHDCQIWYKELKILTTDMHNTTQSGQENAEAIISLNNSLATAEKKIETLAKKSVYMVEELDAINQTLTQNKQDIKNLLAFMKRVNSLTHLMDVDEMWDKTENHQNRIKALEQKSTVHLSKLNDLAAKGTEILEVVTSHSDDIQRHAAQLVKSKEANAALASRLDQNEAATDEKFSVATQASHDAVEELTKKIKYAYWAVGGTAGLAIIEFIILFAKVL